MCTLLWHQHDFQSASLCRSPDLADLHNHLLEWRNKRQHVALTWDLYRLAHSFCTLARLPTSIHYLGTFSYSIHTAYSHNYTCKLLWHQHDYQTASLGHSLDVADLHSRLFNQGVNNTQFWLKNLYHILLTQDFLAEKAGTMRSLEYYLLFLHSGSLSDQYPL